MIGINGLIGRRFAAGARRLVRGTLRLRSCGVAAALLLSAPSWAHAEEASKPTVNGADTAFVMFASALVMLMTPGLGLFYGGMVRRKNVLGTFQQSFIMLGVVGLQWLLIGYSLAFGPDLIGGFIGSPVWAGLSGVGLEPNADYAATIPHQAYMVFQCMFAVIT
ncbi:MAG: ammonium transporter, partial [Planctomycetota bacterium]|nr:ammonium transporter [Planctomycetota bacterium]